MKILYGVQGTGNGHTTRARVMAKAFAETDIQVDWVFSGRKEAEYFDMQPFGNYRTFQGMTFVVRKGKVDVLRTAVGNNLARFWKEVKSLDLSGYDLVIVDFEPVTAWAARRAGVKTLGLSHQCAFTYDIPKKNNNPVTDTVMKLFAPVEQPIGLHWHHFNAPILPPIIDTDHLAQSARAEQDSSVVFYHPFMELEQKLSLLSSLDRTFYVYHGVPEPIDHGNVKVMPYSRDGFQQHLAACEGVIASAGFELTSEAIHLGKKLLVTPLKGQMEQFSNGAALEKLGFATVEEELDRDAIAAWLDRPKPSPYQFPDVARALVAWLQDEPRCDISDLARSLWSMTDESVAGSEAVANG